MPAPLPAPAPEEPTTTKAPPLRVEPEVLKADALKFVDETFPTVADSVSEDLRPSLFLYLCAQVTGAYRVEYRETLSDEEREAFGEVMWNASLTRFVDRFGRHTPVDDDDFDPEAELAEWFDDCASLWADFIERAQDGHLEQAWLFALRKNYFESQAPEWVDAQTEIAVKLARQLPALT